MVKKFMLLLILVVFIIFNFSQITLAQATKYKNLPSTLKIGTSTVGGAYYIVGMALAEVLEKEFGIPVSAAPTEGSTENIRLLEKRELDLAIIAVNTAYPAFRGMLKWEKKMDFLRSLIGLYEHPSPFVTLTKSGIKNFSDLRGKRVGVGASRATWDPISKPIFECEGIKWEEIKPVYGSHSDLATQLKDGMIDAYNSMAYPGGSKASPALTELFATRSDVILIKHSDKIKDIGKYAEWMNPAVVLPGAPGVKKQEWPNGFPCVNIGGPAIMARADMNDELVYLITKTIYQNLANLAKKTPYWEFPLKDPGNLVRAKGVPFHPSAIRFLKEVGLWKN